MELQKILSELAEGKEVETKGSYLTPIMKSVVMGIPIYSVVIRGKYSGGNLTIDNPEFFSGIIYDDLMGQQFGICHISKEFIDNDIDDSQVFKDPAGNWIGSLNLLQDYMEDKYGDNWRLTEKGVAVRAPEDRVLAGDVDGFVKEEDGFWQLCGIKSLEDVKGELFNNDENTIQL